ncbi:sodium:solute symporter family protein [Magnetospirillum sp. UT-4]|uniref:sodium:solute symporter family protein n=1 Tax=Magnetospirillum sp. UT-4 TaxID=2681467 RepID=UPI0013855A94|nr:sodium:solute symporter family protein [Magnetospirillum sp. UT-4]CAA7626429.1 Na+/solute symporter (Ssf family) [Magnetospirillum sp. UT-4]
MSGKSTSFIDNLGKVYAYYTGGFVTFTIVLAILEQMGVPNKIIGYAFIFLTIGVYALIGVLSRTAEVSEYYVAGRVVPAFYNGMATGADWMSAASFIGMAGTLYMLGYDGLAFVLGWTGGYVLVAILLAPYLRKFGQFTVPDFLGARYGGNVARTMGVIVLITASFAYVVAQIFGVGIIASRFLGISFELAVFVGLAGILVCSMLGGMRAVTWTQVAQYIILITAYLIPVVWMSVKLTGIPIPQLMYGQALAKITALEPALGIAKGHVAAFSNAKGQFDMLAAVNFFLLIGCLMIGTASLPHILMRYFTTPSVKQARQSVGWSLFFIFLLYFTAPSYAAFAKLEVYQNVVGLGIDQLPQWVKAWGQVGLVGACDAANAAESFAMCKGVVGNADGVLQLAEFKIHPDAIVLATPEIAGLPYVVAGLVAAGGLAAALSTADGLLLAIANALSHDVYYRMIDPKADTKKRLIASRVLLICVAIVAAYVASLKPSTILSMVAWAFSIAASGLFPALVMGVWWKRTTNVGAVAGMIVGFGVCLYYLITTQFYGAPLWFGIKNISCGAFGIPAAFLVTYVVSLMTPAPSQEMQDFIDSIRVPKGDVVLADASQGIDK